MTSRAAAIIGTLVALTSGCKEFEPRSIAFGVPEKLNVGSDAVIEVQVFNSDSHVIPGARVSFLVEPASFAAVNEGRLRCLREGAARVTASAGSIHRSASVECVDPGRLARDGEARANLKGLFVAQKSYFQERDNYSPDFSAVGFEPESCRDGTRPVPPTSRWITGCHYAYTVTFEGVCPNECGFTAYARGMGPEDRRDWILRAPRITAGDERPEDFGVPRRLEPSDGHLPLQ